MIMTLFKEVLSPG